MDYDFLITLEQIIEDRKTADGSTSYVASLHSSGTAKIARKVGEEAIETVVAALSGDKRELTAEAADLLFHLLILLSDGGLKFDDVLCELRRREGQSGHDEKAGRTC